MVYFVRNISVPFIADGAERPVGDSFIYTYKLFPDKQVYTVRDKIEWYRRSVETITLDHEGNIQREWDDGSRATQRKRAVY